jgi:chromate reductase
MSLKIAGIAGSIRSQSYSKSILSSLAHMLPAGSRFDAIDIGTIPHYNEDVEHHALPESVVNARRLVQGCDALVLVVPEFNHGMPGVLKNALDWLSRPAFQSCMHHKPVLFATLSPGALGGVRAQYQLRETLSSMLCQLVPLPEIAITHVGAKVVDGRLADPATSDFLKAALGKFLHAANLDLQKAAP